MGEISQRDDFAYRLLKNHLKEGMRVLDIGCGSGDVSFLAAQIVGEKGSVTGIDNNTSLLDMGKRRLEESTLKNLSFIEKDLKDISDLEEKYDAITGRWVLMYLPDPEKTLALLKKLLVPGGIMIFQESDAMGARLNQDFPCLGKVQDWIWETVKKEGGDIHIGSKLYALMKQNDLRIEDYISENVLQTAESGSDLAWVVKMMMPRLIEHGIIAEETDMNSLECELEKELSESSIAFLRDMAFGICAVKE